jgi:hypothetical protein
MATLLLNSYHCQVHGRMKDQPKKLLRILKKAAFDICHNKFLDEPA